MTESQIQTKFTQYLRCTTKYFYYELKVATLGRFFYRNLKDHQINGLLVAKEHGFVWKLSDADPREKPFDGFSAPPMNAYLGIAFDNVVCLIDIDLIVIDKIANKSIKFTKAKEIAQYVVVL